MSKNVTRGGKVKARLATGYGNSYRTQAEQQRAALEAKARDKEKRLEELIKRQYESYTDSQQGSLFSTTTSNTITSGTWGTTYPSHQHTLAPPNPLDGLASYQTNVHGPMEGLDELCQLMEVQPTTELTGLLLLGASGQHYSLVDLIAGQLSIMEKLHVLLVHRQLTPEAGA